MKMNQILINKVKGLVKAEKFQEIAVKIDEYITKLNRTEKCEDIIADLIYYNEDYLMQGSSIAVNFGDIYLDSKYDEESLDQDKYYYVKYINKNGELHQIIEDLDSQNIEKIMINIKKHLTNK